MRRSCMILFNMKFIYVKQKHSADMIFAEVLCILNWYNPFAWLIKKVICQNLEFIADHQVLNSGLDKKQYQYLLLKVAGSASFRIANQFNFSFLRKRILMMNKMKSAKLHLVRFLFVLPLLAVLLLSFRQNISGILENQPGSMSGAGTGDATSAYDRVASYLMADTVPAKERTNTPAAKSSEVTVLLKDTTRLFAGDSPHQPLFIVDEIIRDKEYVEALDPSTIESVEVLKDKHALQYGDNGKYGVVRIHTKPAAAVTANNRRAIGISITPKKQVRVESISDSVAIEADKIIIAPGKSDYGYSGADSAYAYDYSNRKSLPRKVNVKGVSQYTIGPADHS